MGSERDKKIIIKWYVLSYNSIFLKEPLQDLIVSGLVGFLPSIRQKSRIIPTVVREKTIKDTILSVKGRLFITSS